MGKNRYLPFGYRIKDGKIVPHIPEAESVRIIFEEYAAGSSYADIAEQLQRSGVRYHEDTPAWHKHMVKRILENERYTGTKGYPAIIPESLFQAVDAKRKSKAPRQPAAKPHIPDSPKFSPDIIQTVTNLKAIRLENQIKQELSKPVLEPDRLRKMIFQCALDKYEAILAANKPIQSNHVDAGSVHFDIQTKGTDA